MSNIILYTRNILETGTVSVTGAPDTGYPEARLYDRCLNLYWKDTVTAAITFTVDQGATDNLAINFLVVDKHNFSGKDMQWQWSTDNFVADINDVITDWTQGDNNQITKLLSWDANKRYWRVTVSSIVNPKCSEIYMSYGYEFSVLADPSPVAYDKDNVQWNRTVGGVERSTKFGEEKRIRNYSMLLSSAELTNFRTAMDDLNGYSSPFYIKDHEDDYWLCRLQNIPEESFDHIDYTRVNMNLLEML